MQWGCLYGGFDCGFEILACDTRMCVCVCVNVVTTCVVCVCVVGCVGGGAMVAGVPVYAWCLPAHGVEGMEVLVCVHPEGNGALAQGLVREGPRWAGRWGPAPWPLETTKSITLPSGTRGPTAENHQTPLPLGPSPSFEGGSCFFSFLVTCGPSFLEPYRQVPSPFSILLLRADTTIFLRFLWKNPGRSA